MARDLLLTAVYEEVEQGWTQARIAEIPAVITAAPNRAEAKDLLEDALRNISRAFLKTGSRQQILAIANRWSSNLQAAPQTPNATPFRLKAEAPPARIGVREPSARCPRSVPKCPRRGHFQARAAAFPCEKRGLRASTPAPLRVPGVEALDHRRHKEGRRGHGARRRQWSRGRGRYRGESGTKVS